MKWNGYKWLAIVLMMALLLLNMTSCLVNPGHATDHPESTDSVTKQSDGSESMTQAAESEMNEPIRADLNRDGNEDDIVIIYGNEEKHTATIRVLNGKDGTELFADTLVTDANKTGAYYLQLGKDNEPDKLVYWDYSYLNDGRLAFAYSVFRFDSNGKELSVPFSINDSD